MLIWDQSNETIDRDELAQVQLERLQASIFRAYRNVAFYRKRFDALGIAPEDIASLDSLRTLPFTTKDDLRNGYPYDMLAVPLREVVRLHSSSWGTGRPTVTAYTRNDLRHWNDLNARNLTAGGVTRDDVVQILFGSGMLTNGLAFHSGAERIGASVIPASPADIEQQITILQDFRTTIIVGTPGDAAQLAEVVRRSGIDPRRLSLRVGLFGAEPWSEQLRAQIEESLGIIALDHYLLSEAGGPGIACECRHKCGLHAAEDHFILEIVDPVTGDPVPDGEEGELVITTLTKEALPLIRFRTRDLTRRDTQPCECGRTLARIARITSRTDGMLFAQGRKFHPSQFESILTEIEGTQPIFQLIIDRKDGVEEVELVTELLSSLQTDTIAKVLSIEQKIAERVRQVTGIIVRVRLVEHATITRLTDAASRVVDRRA